MTVMPTGFHAVVTGASRGIGAAIADALAEAGALVSRLGRLADSRMQEICGALEHAVDCRG